MGNLIEVDAWLHNVFTSKLPLGYCEKKFREFSLAGDKFILDEIKNSMIPYAEKMGYVEAIESYNRMIKLLEQCMEDKVAEKGTAHETCSNQ